MADATEVVPLTKDTLLGAWRMRSRTYEIVGTGEKRDALGADPHGWIIYNPERVMVLALNRNRKKPVELVPTSEEKLALYDTMFAYSGTYTVKSDRVIHHLDMSWNEAWTGTEQVRFCKIEGDILTYTSAPAKNPVDGSEVVHTVKFERAT
jgi:Lipocalin-like domain